MVAQVEVSQQYTNSDYVRIEAMYGPHTHTLSQETTFHTFDTHEHA